ncbi:TonB-dependent receptor [Porticoccus sp. W117]|uniref:TonB-dependent receptor n=1 Tax=Porticoccus sp. W117 TaxID=3054777 RepID=UPI0025938E27|nr:TonB-dependent receptor [Porticoccus sp. W117]MDM3870840.1 TonB-dependent receptor [Porticoccus sp. W117]
MNYLNDKQNVKSLVRGIASALALTASGTLLADNTEFSLDIEQQKAGSALLTLSKVSGVQIMLPQTIGAGIELPAVKGEHSVESALNVMLSGTGLTYEYASDNTIVIKQGEGTPEAKKALAEADEEVVITGTLLRNVHPTSPVVTFDREDFERLGVSTVEDVLRKLPQNRASFNSESSRNSPLIDNQRPLAGNGHQGNAAVNLRGLGSDSTLVLINGRRTSGSPIGEASFVNLSTISLGTVERIEIILDGASALYGSDAVGGVINIITSRDYRGAETSVRYENGLNGGNVYSLNQTVGFGWESGNAQLTLSKRERQATSQVKAGFTSLDFRPRGGSDFSTDFFGSLVTASPGLVFEGVEAFPGFFVGGDLIGSLPEGNSGVGAQPSDFDLALGQAAMEQAFLDREFAATTENTSLSLSLQQEFSGVDTYLDINYSKTENDGGDGTPSFLGRVPVDNPFNPFGRVVVVNYRFDQELADGLLSREETLTQQERMEVSLGFKAELPFSDWLLSTDLTASRESTDNNTTAYFFTSPRDGGPNGRDILNVFGDGSAQADVNLDDLYRYELFPNAPEVTLLSFRSVAEGGLFDMAGGESRLAVGLEVRETEVNYSEDPNRSLLITGFGVSNAVNVDTDTLNNLTTTPKEQVGALFAEVSLPLVGSDNSLPGIESFLVTLAARTERYELPDAKLGSGSSYSNTSPKIGFTWGLTETLNVQGTWGESFRAPTARQITSPEIITPPGFIRDPFNPGGEAFVQAFRHIGGNGDLKPEVSKTMTLSMRWTPEFLEGAYMEVLFNQADTTDEIDTPRPFGALGLANLSNPDIAIRDSNGVLTNFLQLPTNLNDSHQKSIDVRAGYALDTERGAFTANFTGTYNKEQKFVLVNGDVVDLRGTEQAPSNWAARADFGWSEGNYGINLTANYHSGFNYTDGGFLDTPDRVEHYTTYDVTGYYNLVDSGWRFLAGVLDLTHTPPPFVNNQASPWDLSRVSSRGRVMYLEAKKEFQL